MNCNEAVELLDTILDGQASEKEKKRFFTHLDKCAPCFDHYELDRLFNEFIKNNGNREYCPPAVFDQLRAQIKDLP